MEVCTANIDKFLECFDQKIFRKLNFANNYKQISLSPSNHYFVAKFINQKITKNLMTISTGILNKHP